MQVQLFPSEGSNGSECHALCAADWCGEGSSGKLCGHSMVRAGSLPTKGKSSGSESGGSSPEAEGEDRLMEDSHKCYRNADLCISGNILAPDWKPEPGILCPVPSAHSNPKGGTQAVKDVLAGQGR